ncbi:hypothetical protein [Orenia marismortui]|uniref:Uncharacterized protein n=1 Tax=Orenia marismortui TaxID=46469 RepID=A0A4R8GSM7_9FIRM|nr:hypothetical protein [Orenia marismortui]TDX48950.1 hypothetical protein C7959_12315 [Orenia marismortui]
MSFFILNILLNLFSDNREMLSVDEVYATVKKEEPKVKFDKIKETLEEMSKLNFITNLDKKTIRIYK